MKEEIETIINTEDEIRLAVSEWEENKVWISIQARQSTMYLTLTQAEAEKLSEGLLKILNKEVV
jgi:hypothetical protein